MRGASKLGSERPYDFVNLQVIISCGEVDYALTRQRASAAGIGM